MKSQSDYKRVSFIEEGEIYFWTATINKWQSLLHNDMYKDVVISSLEYLSKAGKIDVFAFVIMPNHIHLIWRMKEPNGKETLQGSFLKFTAHEFRKMILKEDPDNLVLYKVTAHNKLYEFWQTDSMAIHLYTREVAYQKLEYVHNNPLTGHWHLADNLCDYKYSSASYYELNDKHFSFLKDLREEF